MDEHLRALARHATIYPTELETRIAHLRGRLRSGELSDEQLALGTWLGDPAALAIVGKQDIPERLEAWIDGFHRWGMEARVRAALALCEHVSVQPKLVLDPLRGAGKRLGDPDTALLAVEAVRDWLRCPCEAHRKACWRAADNAGCDYPSAKRSGDPAWGAYAQTSSATAYLVSSGPGYEVSSGHEAEAARAVASDDALRRAVATALLPWVWRLSAVRAPQPPP